MLTGDGDDSDDGDDVKVDDLYTCVCPVGKAWDADGMDCVAVASDEGDVKEPEPKPEPEPDPAPVIKDSEQKPEDDPAIEPEPEPEPEEAEPEPVDIEPVAMEKAPKEKADPELEPKKTEGGMPTGIESLNYGIMSLIASGGMLALFKRKK